MSHARNLLYAFINEQIKKGAPVEPCDDADDTLHYLLNRIEEDRAHAEAEKLRNEAKLYAHEAVDTTGREAESNLRTSRELIYAASLIDPYEERDGHLVRKSDGTTAYL